MFYHRNWRRYTNDVWRLNWQALRWEQATAAPGDDAPLPRRGHSLLHYKVRTVEWMTAGG